jgi:murein DD-endopeptidase MepM/ murein hydrolase activator NlpD
MRFGNGFDAPNSTIKRLSEIGGQEIINLYDGGRLGVIADVDLLINDETGRIEALGWNQYGGWRIGIRSLDNKRYYYYAHLRKGHPYVKSLKEGDIVYAGDVIGYLGMTGYSRKEDVNNINVPHLHFGTQLIFDESQKETLAEIWINVYDIVEILSKNRSPVTYNEKTKECERIYDIRFHNVPERTINTDKTIPST